MRQFGILLHISSLPSPYGIGDLGPAAHTFASTIATAGASIWQFLPLHPTSTFIGNSPYSSPSAFAGNMIFISPDKMVEDGYITQSDIESALSATDTGLAFTHQTQVNYTAATRFKEHLMHIAFEKHGARIASDPAYTAFCHKNTFWLHDYARFVAIKQKEHGAAWTQWPEALRTRKPFALEQFDLQNHQAIAREKFIQFIFYTQWEALQNTCRTHELTLMSDVPIYVTHDSADVWTHPQYFLLNPQTFSPVNVAGVPPDYFSETGQRWGNPIYRWDVLSADGYTWWKNRLGHELTLADLIRLDHFRGFCDYWEIPATEETAINGHWTPGPRDDFFSAMKAAFPNLPFVAEDLGIITQDVRDLMNAFDLPGMHVVQFAFGGHDIGSGTNITHNHHRNSFVYTGTHDNAPTKAWLNEIPAAEHANLDAYTGMSVTNSNVCDVLIRQAFSSVSRCAVIPMQDVLHLGPSSRMNTPGTSSGNWEWRLSQDQMSPHHFEHITHLARLYGRLRPSAH